MEGQNIMTNPDALEQIARLIESYISHQREEIQRYDQSLQAAGADWDDDDYRTLALQAKRLSTDINRGLEELQNFPRFLHAKADVLKQSRTM